MFEENQVDVDLKLDEDFLYILKFAKDSMNVFEGKTEQEQFSGAWMLKLCQDVVSGITAKRIRNNYLSLLVSCFQLGELIPMFMEYPPPGNLPPLPEIDGVFKDPPWLKALIQEGDGALRSEKNLNCRSYVKSKIFEENRGACVYMAMSVPDAGDIPYWVNVGGGMEATDNLEKTIARIRYRDKLDAPRKPEDEADLVNEVIINRDDKKYKAEILDAIGNELIGFTLPGESPKLEKLIVRFKEYITEINPRVLAPDLTGRKLRHFLLVTLQSELINDDRV